MRTGNCSSKVHTAKVEIFSNHQKNKVASIVDRAVLQGRTPGLPSKVKEKG